MESWGEPAAELDRSLVEGMRKPKGIKASKPAGDQTGHQQRTHVTDLHANLPGTPRVVDDGTVANHEANTAAKEDHARLLRRIHLDDRLSGRYDEKGSY